MYTSRRIFFAKELVIATLSRSEDEIVSEIVKAQDNLGEIYEKFMDNFKDIGSDEPEMEKTIKEFMSKISELDYAIESLFVVSNGGAKRLGLEVARNKIGLIKSLCKDIRSFMGKNMEQIKDFLASFLDDGDKLDNELGRIVDKNLKVLDKNCDEIKVFQRSKEDEDEVWSEYISGSSIESSKQRWDYVGKLLNTYLSEYKQHIGDFIRNIPQSGIQSDVQQVDFRIMEASKEYAPGKDFMSIEKSKKPNFEKIRSMATKIGSFLNKKTTRSVLQGGKYKNIYNKWLELIHEIAMNAEIPARPV